MVVAATSGIAKLLAALRTVLSNCATFQDRTNSATAAEALKRIFVEYFVDEESMEVERPYAVVCEVSHEYSQIGQGDGNYLHTTSTELHLVLTDENRYVDITDGKIDFLNFVGACIDELAAFAGQNEYLPMIRIAMETPAQRTHRQNRTTENDYWWCRYVVSMGDAE